MDTVKDTDKDSWFMYHGSDNHGGYVSGGKLNSEFVGDKTKFGLLTSIETQGSILSAPAIRDNTIYVGFANSRNAIGSNGGTLQKFDITTGKMLKEFTWSIEVEERDVHGFTGMGCTPTVVNGFVYFIGFDAVIYCLEEENLTKVWSVNLRYPDVTKNQPVLNTGGHLGITRGVPAEGWSSPLVINVKDKPKVIFGIGEGENPFLMSFIYCLDATTGIVDWIYCTCQFKEGEDNQVNHIPSGALDPGVKLPSQFTEYTGDVFVQGASVWSAIAYDEETGLLYAGTGQPARPSDIYPVSKDPGTGADKGLNDSPGYSSGILSLNAESGAFHKFTQMPAGTSYRPTSDYDVDIGSAPTVYTITNGIDQLKGKKVVGISCKNGGFMICDANTLELITSRCLLPYNNDNYTLTLDDNGQLPKCQTPQTGWEQITTVDPHPENVDINPFPDNTESNKTWAENYSGPFNTAAVDPENGIVFIGIGGPNYHSDSPGIDRKNTPFMRAIKWDTLEDAWDMTPADANNPRRYKNMGDTMYSTSGECGLSSPSVVNDVVFVTTTKVAIHAFNSKDGTVLFSNTLGNQTGGMQGGYGYSLGASIYKDYVVAGGLVQAMEAGGVLNIYGPLSLKPNYPS